VLLGVSGVAASHTPVQRDGLVAARRNLMPVPASVVWQGEALGIGRDFAVSIQGPSRRVEPRVQRAVLRMLGRLAGQTGIPLTQRIEADPQRAHLRIEYAQAAGGVQQAVEVEAYTLDVGADGGVLRAPTPYGVLRGLETFLQLVEVADPAIAGTGQRASARAASIADLAAEPVDFIVPGVSIRDAPRFPWRGLLIDPGRHFLSLEVMKRNLDAMAAVKLNVLHWHLSEDQGFRVESKVFAKLHELGSGGLYYTQDEIRELIAYARDRGIRVMPEFDMPGHATSWFVGYPELASAPGPYEIIERWGIQDPAMDPTSDQTYEFLAAFIAEMAGLFPDPYFHIGGDEVNGNQWNESAEIQQFIVDHGLGDNHGLQSYFNRRIQPMLSEHGKKMVGWDEIFHPDLPQETVIHSWRGQESLAAAARVGYPGILSNGYYIDLMRPAAQHYAVDPLGGPAADLDTEERKLVLGGEATMWGEYVVDETIDSRIWPRTAAIAERFWSAASVTEVDDMYRRLEETSVWLQGAGVTHVSGYMRMLERLAGSAPVAPLRTLADVVEPIKGYRRGRSREYTRFTPLNRLVDAARPESEVARRFALMVDEYVALAASSGAGGPAAAGVAAGLRTQLIDWRDNHEALVPVARASTMLPEAEALSTQLRTVARIGLAALEDMGSGRRPSAAEQVARGEALDGVDVAHGALRVMVVVPVQRLVAAAGGGEQ
jgi:hexosaminidase